MGLDFLHRVQKAAILAGLVLLPVIGAYLGWKVAVAWALGCAWSLANIVAIELLIKTVTVPSGRRSKWRVVWMCLVKVPLLYGAGFVLLESTLPVPALLAGFMWPLGVIVLKAVGRVILRLDRTESRALEADVNTTIKP